jgi:phospholipase/carboxylesterase
VQPSNSRRLTRRDALLTLGSGLALLSGCGADNVSAPRVGDARLKARPSTPTETPPVGLERIPITVGVDGLVYFPASYKPTTPAPGAFLLHGAGQDASELMAPVSTYAESRGLVLASVTSSQATWDAIYGGFGPDVQAIDAALNWLFARCAVDTKRLGVMGFSDGATYAIALTRANGDLFKRVNVYSPGYLISVAAVGKPEYFVTHGTRDQILSFDNTKNVIVPTLRDAGYSVDFRQFDGGHGVTAQLLETSVDWFVRP